MDPPQRNYSVAGLDGTRCSGSSRHHRKRENRDSFFRVYKRLSGHDYDDDAAAVARNTTASGSASKSASAIQSEDTTRSLSPRPEGLEETHQPLEAQRQPQHIKLRLSWHRRSLPASAQPCHPIDPINPIYNYPIIYDLAADPGPLCSPASLAPPPTCTPAPATPAGTLRQPHPPTSRKQEFLIKRRSLSRHRQPELQKLDPSPSPPFTPAHGLHLQQQRREKQTRQTFITSPPPQERLHHDHLDPGTLHSTTKSNSRFAEVTLASKTYEKGSRGDRGNRGSIPSPAAAAAGVTGTEEATISSGSSPSAEPGLLGRLFRRGRNKSTGKHSGRETYVALDDENTTEHQDLLGKGGQRERDREFSRKRDSEAIRTGNLPTTAGPVTVGAQVPSASAESSPMLQRPSTAPAAEAPAAARKRSDSTTTPTPLKKRPSIRDRFRLSAPPSLPGQRPEPERQGPPVAAYVPRHAAADFSRMVVSPRHRESFSHRTTSGYHHHVAADQLASPPTFRERAERLEPISSDPGEDELNLGENSGRTAPVTQASQAAQQQVVPQRRSQIEDPTARLLDAATDNSAGPQHQQQQQQEQQQKPQDQRLPVRPRHQHQRHSYSLRSDPLEPHASPDASCSGPALTPSCDATSPVQSQRTGPDIDERRSSSLQPRQQQEEQVPPTTQSDQAKSDQAESDDARPEDEQSSDYQLFLQRAEEHDRILRDKFWRKLTQNEARAASATPAAYPMQHHQLQQQPWTPPLDGIEEVQGDFSTGTTAVNAHSSRHSRSKRDSSGPYGYGGSSQQAASSSQPRRSGERHPGQRASWTPSYYPSAAGGGFEQLDRGRTTPDPAATGEKRPAGRRHTVESYGGGGGYVGATTAAGAGAGSPGHSYMLSAQQQQAQQQPRALRRQSSITQRIAEYIRPPRDAADDAPQRPQSWAQTRRY